MDSLNFPLKHGGEALYAPLPFFLPVTQNYHEAPIPEILDLANLFVADAPVKKNQEI